MNAQDRPNHHGCGVRSTRTGAPWTLLLPLVALLGGCKPDPTKVAVAACRDEIPKHTQLTWEMDNSRVTTDAKADAGGVTEFIGPIVFEKGMSSESTQIMHCRAVIGSKDGKTTVDVISVQFFPVDDKIKP